MNRFINALLLFISMPALLAAIYIGFDMPIGFIKTTGQNLEYREEIMLGFGLIIFIINLRRSFRRWMGLRIVSKTAKFKWSEPVSKSRVRRVVTYTMIEAIVMLCFGFGMYQIASEAWLIAAAYGLAGLDGIVFSMFSQKYRVGLSSKALIVADRDVVVMYFNGLRKVSLHQQTVYFDYIKDLQLTFAIECIAEEKRPQFFKELRDQLNPDKVYFSGIKEVEEKERFETLH